MKNHDPLYVTEIEIAKLVGMTLPEWEAVAKVLDRSGLPQRDPLFKQRRYWPACRAFFDRRSGVKDYENTRVVGAAAAVENWD